MSFETYNCITVRWPNYALCMDINDHNPYDIYKQTIDVKDDIILYG